MVGETVQDTQSGLNVPMLNHRFNLQVCIANFGIRHGKFTYTLTGREVSIYGNTRDAYNYEAVLEAVRETAEKAKGAWKDFPDSIPCLNAKGQVVKDLMFHPFESGRDIKQVDPANKKRYDDTQENRVPEEDNERCT